MIAANCVHDPLACFATDGSVRPYLAQSIVLDDDYRAITIVLRDGVRFHDDSLLDARAAADLFERHRASVLTGQALDRIARIETCDRLRFRMVFKEPWASFPALLTGQLGLMAGPESALGEPNGTGPFRLVNRDAQTLRLVANKRHWRPNFPRMAKAELVAVPDPDAREAAFDEGRIDLFHSTHASTIARWRRQAPSSIREAAPGTTDTGCIMLNLSADITSDAGLRLALAHALDRSRLVDEIFGSVVPLADSPFGNLDAPIAFPAFDPAMARQLVHDFCQLTGKSPTIRLATTQTSTNLHFARLVAEMWAQVGVHTCIEQMAQSELIARALLGDFDAIEWHQFGAGDLEENAIFWDPAKAAPPGSIALNMARNGDPELGVLLRKARSTEDPSTRRDVCREISGRMNVVLPYLWLNQTPYAVIFRDHLRGVCEASFPDGATAIGMIAGRFRVSEIATNGEIS
jgi:ABC-type transport system substrate-binding protein